MRDYQELDTYQPPSPAGAFLQIMLGVIFLLLVVVGLIAGWNTFLKAAPMLVQILVVLIVIAGPGAVIVKGAKAVYLDIQHARSVNIRVRMDEERLFAMEAARRRDDRKAEAETEKMRAEAVRIRAEAEKLLTMVEWDAQGNAARWDPQQRRIIQVQGQMREHPALHSLNYRYDYRDTSTKVTEEEGDQDGSDKRLPTHVLYESIAHQVPRGHTLLGIGTEGLETRDFSVLDTCWICGGSKTGKTNTVALKVEEAYNQGDWFIVIDPHRFKPDSLYNSIKQYSSRFLMPVAQTHEEIMDALLSFLTEAKRRREGGAYDFKIKLIVDEVGSLTGDKGKTPEQQELFKLLYNIARMCGQELRGFGMAGWFISQNAVGLAWLRAFAMTIIVHKLLMENERKVATNSNMAIVHDMDTWPRGRVLVYGLDIEEGQLTLQMPLFRERVVDSVAPGAQQALPAGTYPVPGGTPEIGRVESQNRGTDNISFFPGRELKKEMHPGTPVPAFNPLPEQAEQGTDQVPVSPDDKQFTIEQEAEFIRRYKACGSIKEVLSQMHLGYGRYQRCASRVVQERGLRRA